MHGEQPRQEARGAPRPSLLNNTLETVSILCVCQCRLPIVDCVCQDGGLVFMPGGFFHCSRPPRKGDCLLLRALLQERWCTSTIRMASLLIQTSDFELVGLLCFASLTMGQLAKYSQNNVTITAGQDLLQNYTLFDTSSGSPKDKVFCRTCGCTLWTIPSHNGGGFKIVRTSLINGGYASSLILRYFLLPCIVVDQLDSLETFVPTTELFAARKPKSVGGS